MAKDGNRQKKGVAEKQTKPSSTNSKNSSTKRVGGNTGGTKGFSITYPRIWR